MDDFCCFYCSRRKPPISALPVCYLATSNTPSSGSNLAIDTSFTGVSTVINNRTYYLGQEFTSGVASPEVQKYSGNVVYVDNRPSITRSTNQKEDIKVILQF